MFSGITTEEIGKRGFRRCSIGGVAFYSCRAFEKLPYLRHGFSTRHGGVGAPPEVALNLSYSDREVPERVSENRRRLLAALNLQGVDLATVAQIHSDRVHIIEDGTRQWNCRTPGDALATRLAGVAIAVQVADCLPVLIADPETGAIAVVHAGWRGILLRILAKTVERMIRAFGSDPGCLMVALGPGIRSCCMEVGREVASSYEEEYPGGNVCTPIPSRPGKRLLDLRRALDIQGHAVGISARNFYDLGACTRCNTDEFFSYRGERDGFGRMMAVIARVES
jgi:YfiH family protein